MGHKEAVMRKLLSGLLILPLLVGCGTTDSSAPVSAAETTQDLTKGLSRFTQKAYVQMQTNKGLILLEVDGTNAPIGAGNFLDLVKRRFYDGLVFHRVVPNFVIQGGDPNGNGSGGFIDPVTRKERNIPLEIKPEFATVPVYGRELAAGVGDPQPLLRHKVGVLAWARSQDPNSASSQFYITLADTTFLDGKYSVFGRVIKGMDVVNKIVQGDKMTKVTLLDKPPTP